MENKTNKEQVIETAKAITENKELAIVETVEDNVTKIKFKDFHSKKYLDNLKETTYKDKKVVFVLPNGKEYKNDKK